MIYLERENSNEVTQSNHEQAGNLIKDFEITGHRRKIAKSEEDRQAKGSNLIAYPHGGNVSIYPERSPLSLIFVYTWVKHRYNGEAGSTGKEGWKRREGFWRRVAMLREKQRTRESFDIRARTGAAISPCPRRVPWLPIIERYCVTRGSVCGWDPHVRSRNTCTSKWRMRLLRDKDGKS